MVLGVDVGEDRDTVKNFSKSRRILFPILIDRDTKVSKKYGVRAHPAHFLIDKNGNIISTALGYRDWYDPINKGYIESLLGIK